MPRASEMEVCVALRHVDSAVVVAAEIVQGEIYVVQARLKSSMECAGTSVVSAVTSKRR